VSAFSDAGWRRASKSSERFKRTVHQQTAEIAETMIPSFQLAFIRQRLPLCTQRQNGSAPQQLAVQVRAGDPQCRAITVAGATIPQN